MRPLIVAAILIAVAGPLQAQTTRLVAPDDPLALQAAANLVQPGDTVLVAAGVYTDADADGAILRITRGGTAEQWVTFASLASREAVLEGATIGIQVNAPFVRVEAFEIRHANEHGITVRLGADDVALVNNHIHHIGRHCTETGMGLNGIVHSTSRLRVEGNLIHDIGRLANGEQGCVTPPTTARQNNDHGLYLSGSGGDDTFVEGNEFLNINRGWPVHLFKSGTARNYTIRDNQFSGAHPVETGHIVIAGAFTGLNIVNNTFINPRNAAIRTFRCSGSTGIIQGNRSTHPMQLASEPCLTDAGDNAIGPIDDPSPH